MPSASPRIVIVGAGIIGLSLGWRLQRAGAAVTIVDPDPPGMGASFGNAGAISASSVIPLALPGVLRTLPKMLLDPSAALHVPSSYWLRALPWFAHFVRAARTERVNAVADALSVLNGLAVEDHLTLARDIGAPELISTSGHLHLYRSEQQLAKDALPWSLRRRAGARIEKLGRADIEALEPAIGPDYTIGQFLPDHAHCVNPHRYCVALAQALAAAGASIVQDRVRRITMDGAAATGVDGETAHYPADKVVLAAGAWSAELLRPLGHHVPLETQRGYHVNLPAPGILVRHCIVPADRKVFITPMETGLRVAGTVEFGGLRRPPTPRRADLLYNDLRAVLPAASTEGADGFWMGHRPCLPDSLPVLGSVRGCSNLVLAFGHGHLGLTGAPATARLLTPLILNQPSNVDLRPFALDRF